MGFFSKVIKGNEKLTKGQTDLIEAKVDETQKKYSKKEKSTADLPKKIEKQIKKGNLEPKYKQILKQREPVHNVISNTEHVEREEKQVYIKTGIPGFDELMDKGIPKGTSTLLCGGPGSGKTIMALQILNNAASKGKKCLYMTFEESPKRLRQHMRDFGWEPGKLEKQGKLLIKRYSLFDIKRSVMGLLKKSEGTLMIDLKPVLLRDDFKPDIVIVDSLTAISSGFYGQDETYRIYIEQLFRLLEDLGANSFLIAESSEIPLKLTTSGVEEFLADGVIIIYNIKSGNVRESAIEILKMRGAGFQKKIVAMKIESGKGIIVYPEQEVFGET